MKLTQWMGLFLGVSVLVGPACKRDTPPTTVDQPGVVNVPNATNEPSTNEATAVPGSQARSAEQIAEARCAREARCGNVGAGKEFASEDVCVAKIKVDWREDLTARECPGGVVQKELTECLEEIRNDDCNNPFDSLGRVLACRESDLCKGT